MIETKRIREKFLIIHKDFNWIMIDMIHMTFEMFSLNNACAVNPKAFIIINEWKVADVWVIVRSIDSYEVYHVKSDKSDESQHQGCLAHSGGTRQPGAPLIQVKFNKKEYKTLVILKSSWVIPNHPGVLLGLTLDA